MAKRYNQAQRKETVHKFRNSPEPKDVFAKTEGINVSTLTKWIKEVGTEESPKFIKATIPETFPSQGSVKIRFGEFEIIVDENSNEDLLSLALRGVKAVC